MNSEFPAKGQQQTPGHKAQESAIIESLDLRSWTRGQNLEELYRKLDEVPEAIESEEKLIQLIRKERIPRRIKKLGVVPPEIAFHRFDRSHIEKAHRGLLFNGATEASDGTIVTHETLPLTITQIGVCLVSYQGEQGAYGHRIFRRDLKIKGSENLNELLDHLEKRRRKKRDGGYDDPPQIKSALAQRGLMAYAERGYLMDKSDAPWRMGHGHPFPFELMTGYWASRREMANAAMEVFRKISEHKKVIFIPSNPAKAHLKTLGYALKPLEYLVTGTLEEDLLHRIENGHIRDERIKDMQLEFVEQYGSQFVEGIFLASEYSPPYLFYAHKDVVQTAALIAIADSLLQEHRGFPMLIDIADNICSSTFSAEAFYTTVRNAYADANQPFRYLGERETRSR